MSPLQHEVGDNRIGNMSSNPNHELCVQWLWLCVLCVLCVVGDNRVVMCVLWYHGLCCSVLCAGATLSALVGHAGTRLRGALPSLCRAAHAPSSAISAGPAYRKAPATVAFAATSQ